MMNPATIKKIMDAKAQFEQTHPKFVSFFQDNLRRGLDEGTLIEITVTRPGENPITTNMRVKASDLELFQSLKGLTP